MMADQLKEYEMIKFNVSSTQVPQRGLFAGAGVYCAVLVDCIFTTRIGYIIITGLIITTLLVITGKLKKSIKEVAKNKSRGEGFGRTSD